MQYFSNELVEGVYKHSAESAYKDVSDMTPLEAATHIPMEYMRLLSGEMSTAVDPKDMAFILRRSDVHSIRSYVKSSLELPVKFEQVVKLIGSVTTGLPELEPVQILEFHQRVVDHANTWTPLENETKALSRRLNSFSDTFITTGQAIVEFVNRIEFDRFLSETLRELTDEENARFNQVLLDSTGLKAVDAMKGYLLSVIKQTHDFISDVFKVDVLAKEFERVLTDQLIAEANTKLSAYKNSSLSDEGQVLRERIKAIDTDIEVLSEAYKKHVVYASLGFFGGPIGVAITGGIFGSKAEKIRAQKNRLVAARKDSQRELAEHDRLIGVLSDVQQHFNDVRSRMLGAQAGAKQLADVWGYVYAYLKEALNQLESIDNMARLHRFKLEFSLLLNPWKRVQDYSTHLSTAFNELLDGNSK